MEMLGVYIRYIYADSDWVDRVTVPSNVQMIDDLFDLRVTGDDVSTITLTDTKHRPKSSRTFGGKQCDAHEAGLACEFEMDDRSFRLGDHGRYPA